jgi:hypothetical protein
MFDRGVQLRAKRKDREAPLDLGAINPITLALGVPVSSTQRHERSIRFPCRLWSPCHVWLDNVTGSISPVVWTPVRKERKPRIEDTAAGSAHVRR